MKVIIEIDCNSTAFAEDAFPPEYETAQILEVLAHNLRKYGMESPGRFFHYNGRRIVEFRTEA